MDPAEFVIVESEFATQIGAATQHHLRCTIGEYLDAAGPIGLTKAACRTDVHVGADRPDGVAYNLRPNVNQSTRSDLQIIGSVDQAVDDNIIDSADGDIAASCGGALRAGEADGGQVGNLEHIVDRRRSARGDNDIACGPSALHVEIAG